VVHKLRRGRRVLNVVYGADAELAGSVFGVPVESDRVELTHDQLERFERHCRRNKLGGVREVREPRGDFDPSDPMLAPLTVPVEVRAEWAKCAALPGIMGMVLCEAWPPGRPVPRTMGIGGYQGLGAMFRLYGAGARVPGNGRRRGDDSV
jgi:hypothetical protein